MYTSRITYLLFYLTISIAPASRLKAQAIEGLLEKSRFFLRIDKDSTYYYLNLAKQRVDKNDTLNRIQVIRWEAEVSFSFKADPSEAVLIASEAIPLVSWIGDYSQLCDIYIDLGYYHRYMEDYSTSEVYYNKSLQVAIDHDLTSEIADANNALGVIHYFRGNHIKALDYYQKAAQAYTVANDSVRISKAMNNIAIIYKNQKNYDKAIEFYNKSIEIYESVLGFNPTVVRNRLYNLSRAYHEINHFEAAEAAIRRMIAIDKQDKTHLDSYIVSLTILIEHYIKKEAFDQAISFSHQVTHACDTLEEKGMIPFVQMRLAWAFQDSGELDSALYYLQKNENEYLQTRDEDLKHEFYKNISEVLIGQSEYKDALPYAQAGLEVALNSGVKDWIFQIYNLLYIIHKNLSSDKKALYHFEKYVAYKDSLWNEEQSIQLGIKQNEIALIQSEARNDLLLTETELKEKTIAIQRVTIIGSVVATGLLIVIALLLRKRLIERKKLLKKIEGQSVKLRELDKAKTRFFANISHDLRSPLTLILGALDKITERDYEVLDKESRVLLDTGIKNGKRLLYLADEIMDLTRLEEGKIKLELQHVKIVPYLRLLTKMFSSAADIKSIELKFTNQADDESVIKIDPHQFEKIIYNLLSNAIKFTPENGAVDVQLIAESAYIQIVISDSGPGIPEESLELIFERYYQSSTQNTSQTGVGIGLALVKELVELHGGSIHVNSEKAGSTFTIKLPFKKSDWISKAIIPERSLDVVTRNSLWVDLQEEKERIQIPGIVSNSENAKTILIVEDHKELRTYLQSILSTDFRVFLASNGTHALDILQSEIIDLIITDLMMPYMDGFEFVDHLKRDKDLKKIPVVVVSARTDQKEKLDLIAQGAEDVISKPFDKEELLLKITNITSRAWDANEAFAHLYNDTAEVFEKSIMQRLESLIIKRIDDPHLSVLDLADEMAASERKVYRMIKKISGLTPYELIKEVRWQYLGNYLKNNRVRTATEAAQLIGMSNVSSFSSQYEKRFGHSFKTILQEK